MNSLYYLNKRAPLKDHCIFTTLFFVLFFICGCNQEKEYVYREKSLSYDKSNKLENYDLQNIYRLDAFNKSSDSTNHVLDLAIYLSENLQNIHHTGPDFDYEEEGGLRTQLYYLNSIIAPMDIQSRLHPFKNDKFDLHKTYDFNRYSSNSIRSIDSLFQIAIENDLFISMTKTIYNQHFGHMLRELWIEGSIVQIDTTYFIENSIVYSEKMLDSLTISQWGNDFRNSVLSECVFEELESTTGFCDYHNFISHKYWIRRSIDGSFEAVFNLIDSIIKVYDPEFRNYLILLIKEKASECELNIELEEDESQYNDSDIQMS